MSKQDFPIFDAHPTLHYLDSAATSQKPTAVIEAISQCYRQTYAPIHRGLYPLAEEATAAYEQARQRIAQFIGAASPESLIFTRSATESINLIATGWLQPRLQRGDVVWVSRLEHHANFLPWQRLCLATGAQLKIIELDASGQLILPEANELFHPTVKLIALSMVSNVLGTVLPIQEIAGTARTHNIPVVVDAAQAVAHHRIDVAALQCDFFAFSAHKMYGPNGIGALCATPQRLEEMEPLLVGGGMVDQVAPNGSSWSPSPAKFEAGSPNLADAVGFAAAADYIDSLDRSAVYTQLETLTQHALAGLEAIPGVQIYGSTDASQRVGIIAFDIDGVHPHDIAQIAGEHNVAIRAGHHCCQPLMQSLGIAATARASLGIYNDTDDIDALLTAVREARELFG